MSTNGKPDSGDPHQGVASDFLRALNDSEIVKELKKLVKGTTWQTRLTIGSLVVAGVSVVITFGDHVGWWRLPEANSAPPVATTVGGWDLLKAGQRWKPPYTYIGWWTCIGDLDIGTKDQLRLRLDASKPLKHMKAASIQIQPGRAINVVVYARPTGKGGICLQTSTDPEKLYSTDSGITVYRIEETFATPTPTKDHQVPPTPVTLSRNEYASFLGGLVRVTADEFGLSGKGDTVTFKVSWPDGSSPTYTSLGGANIFYPAKGHKKFEVSIFSVDFLSSSAGFQVCRVDVRISAQPCL